MENNNVKKLFLSEVDKKIAGVCGGIAEYFNVDSALVRVGLIFLDVLSGVVPLVIFYLLAWAVMPHRPLSQ